MPRYAAGRGGTLATREAPLDGVTAPPAPSSSTGMAGPRWSICSRNTAAIVVMVVVTVVPEKKRLHPEAALVLTRYLRWLTEI